jgi:hypothetical protein
MKHIILFASMIFILASCTSSSNKLQEDNIALVKNYVAAVESLNYEAMGDYLADNYMGLGPSYGDTIYKKAAIENWKANIANVYAKIEHTRATYAPVTIAEGPSKGNWVACWSELKITFKTGKSVMIWANSDYKVENGKIVKTITLYNEADALRQMGFQIVAPQ